MILFTKYSNERSPRFCIRTDILEDEAGKRWVRKVPSGEGAAEHVKQMQERYLQLSEDLKFLPLSVNECRYEDGTAYFPYLTGKTLEERLDLLLEQKKTDALLAEIGRYFSMFSRCSDAYEETEQFREIFGEVHFEEQQRCRRISDVDMVFANALQTEEGYALIDYEWTFDFPIPVKYLQYRCLYYYILGNARRDALTKMDIYEQFEISPGEQEQFRRMEEQFQAYILGSHVPVWKLYDDISEGVIPVLPMVDQESRRRKQSFAEVWGMDENDQSFGYYRPHQREQEGRVKLSLAVPEGAVGLRLDPCRMRCILRIEELSQGGETLVDYTVNGVRADNGDFICDTEDPQIVIRGVKAGTAPVQITFLAEPFTGLNREMVLNQMGKIRWMEQTKAWKLYRKLKPEG